MNHFTTIHKTFSGFSLTAVFLSLSFTYAFAASPPDMYEGFPYDDNSSGTTKNVISFGIPQFHTIDSPDDIDWGICMQIEPGSAPYTLEFTDLVIPSGDALIVNVYRDGPSEPPIEEFITSGEIVHNVNWTGTGVIPVLFSVQPYSSVVPFVKTEPAMSYTILYIQPVGANNGLASAIGSTRIDVQWNTTGAAVTSQGFNVLRSLTGTSGSFSTVNPSLIPVPNPSGPWIQYQDGGLQPATIYFYEIELVDSVGNPSTWVGPFYGYTQPASSTAAQSIWQYY